MNQSLTHCPNFGDNRQQLPLMNSTPDHPQIRELKSISRILDEHPTDAMLIRRFAKRPSGVSAAPASEVANGVRLTSAEK
jgi:hypothetical protein